MLGLALAGCAGNREPLPVLADAQAGAAAALEAFRAACTRLPAWRDASGLTTAADWVAPCAAAETTTAASFETFQRTHFREVRLGDGQGFATGYFLPEYQAQAKAAPGLVPVLAPPSGRDCSQAPCPTRAEIMGGALAGRAETLLWMDPVDLFFLQVQGSGIARLPNGARAKLAFAGHNGHPYVAIGQLLRARGALAAGAGMAEIRAWLASHPAEREQLLAANPRYIFFRRLAQDAPFPVGALGARLVAGASVAVDPAHVPMGALVRLETQLADGTPFRRVLVAADTGAAIRGANRFDIYFGEGAAAGRLAGGQQARARAVLLLPRSMP
ncbi:MltA domain-containing protein [Thermaurantiacus sp.]